MQIEYEATFKNIDKDDVRARLEKAGAILVKKEFLQKRMVFYLPNRIRHTWLRVRDEVDKITMSYKKIDGDKIENQKEICLQVDNFKEAVSLLETIGCERKAFQESKRELWKLDGVEIAIDEWPFLEPFVEVEGNSEGVVKRVSEKIGFDYGDALFCAVGKLYRMKYGSSIDKTPRIVFDMENPFVN